jgi:hypothetical protein
MLSLIKSILETGKKYDCIICNKDTSSLLLFCQQMGSIVFHALQDWKNCM